MAWSYEIVPVGGHHRLAGGSFDAPDLEAAKHYVETVYEPAVTADAELDVRLIDSAGMKCGAGRMSGPNRREMGNCRIQAPHGVSPLLQDQFAPLG